MRRLTENMSVTMRLTVAVLASLLLGISAVTGETARRVADVRVEGNRVVRTEQAIGWLEIRTGMVWSDRVEADASERLLQAYRELGYWNASVTASVARRGRDRVRVMFEVEEGALTTVGSVSFSGSIPEPIGQLQVIPEMKAGDAVRPSHVRADAEALMAYLERTGYPYAVVEPDVRVAPGQGVVNVVWRIESGPRVSIDGIRFSGRTTTREDVLARETGLSVGEVYDQRQVDTSTRSLRRLGWLRSVADPVIERDARSGRYVLHYAVEEAKATTVEGGLGMLPQADGGYAWVGRFDFRSDNLAGSGRGARLLWDRPEARSSDLEVGYREPWLLGQPIHGTAGVAFEQRSGYIEAGLALGLEYRPSTKLDVSGTIERSSVRPDSAAGVRVDRERAWSLGTTAVWDGRDDRRLPTRGMRTSAHLVWDNVQRQDLGTDDDRMRYRVETSVYRPLGRRTVLGLRVNGAGLFQKDRPGPNALVRVGGARTIRGYLEEHFLVEHAAWTNLEIMRGVGRGSRGYVFVDGGMLKPVRGSGIGWIGAAGYGVGLQAETRTGTMTVEYGLSKEDSPGKGKVHVRLVGAW